MTIASNEIGSKREKTVIIIDRQMGKIDEMCSLDDELPQLYTYHITDGI